MREVGRKPSVNLNLPKGMRRRARGRKVYFYLDTGEKPRREIPLGSDYILALKKYAELELEPGRNASPTVGDGIRRYLAEVVPTKAPGTQRNNLKEAENLLRFFNDPPCPMDAVAPIHIRQYLDWRKSAPYSANREKALFSHMWNYWRGLGYTDKANPCAGIKGFKEPGRDRYVENEEYQEVWNAAGEPLRDFMDLAYLTNQRPGDVLKMSERDIRDGTLAVVQGKTGAKLRIEVEGYLADVLQRIRDRKAVLGVHSMSLVIDEDGKPLSKYQLRDRFEAAREAAGVNFQIRDIRSKGGTDVAELRGILEAQKLLGHTSSAMTDHYVKKRRGEKVKPLK